MLTYLNDVMFKNCSKAQLAINLPVVCETKLNKNVLLIGIQTVFMSGLETEWVMKE